MIRIRHLVNYLALLFITPLGVLIFMDTPVFAITDATITVNVGSLSSLDLAPGKFGSSSQTITVNTDNYTGYNVNLTNSTDNTDLINAVDSTLTIPTIIPPSGSDSIPANDFTSGYGVSSDGINFYPAPTSSGHISLGNTTIAGANTHTLTFGVKPAIGTLSGTYSKTFIITAVANNPQYSIAYSPNTTDTVSDMPSNESTTISQNGTATISSTTPTRTGYVFLGWDEDSTVTTNPTYSPGDTITLEPTQANAITLYAIWEIEPEPPAVADYTEEFAATTGPSASATTDLTTSGGTGLTPAEYITKIFAYSNNTGRTISSIKIEITYSKANQGATSGYLIGNLKYNGSTFSASPVAVERGKVNNQTITLAEFNNLNIPSSSNISFTINTDSDAFSAGITISSQTVTVVFAD